MQQFAAQKTGLAALPFAASSTARAVSDGVGVSQDSGNSRAFDYFYDRAKSEATSNSHSSEKVLNANQRAQRDFPESKGKGVGLSVREKSYDQKLPERERMQDDVEYAKASNDKGDTPPTLMSAEKNGRLNNDALSNPRRGEITAPGAPDDKLHDTATSNSGEDDNWVAFVDDLLNKNTSGDAGAFNNVHSIESLGEKVSEIGQLSDIAGGDSVESVINHLLTQLQIAEDADNTGSVLTNDVTAAVKALSSLLNNTNASGEDVPHFGELMSDSASDLQQLITQLTNNTNEEATSIPHSVNRDLEGGQDTLGALNAQDRLVLGILQDEIGKVADTTSNLHQEGGPNNSMLDEQETAQTLAQNISVNAVTNTDASDRNVDVINKGITMSSASDVRQQSVSTLDNDASLLLTTIGEMPTQTAQKATEAFAEQMVSGMPNTQQQQTVKANIIAGINEFQQQVKQGREPGIDLSAIVADAVKEAQLNSDVAASLTAKVDSHANHLLQLINNVQSSAIQVLQGQLGQTDTLINENNQLRAEASKTQQQLEGFDKAVNIHKPEGQQQLNEKIRWMVNARNTMAEIRLDPPELGSMQVRVNVSSDVASVSFIVQSQQAKDALAEAMPKLRDMLSQQGIELADAQVKKDNSSGSETGQQFANNSGNSNSLAGNQHNTNNDGFDENLAIEQSVTRQMKGGIDYYA